jgi:hypothetical protein
MKPKHFITLLLCYFVQLCHAQKVDTIKFESILNLIKIPVDINGKTHFFIFDTGATFTVLIGDLATKVGTITGYGKVTDAMDNVTKQPTYKVNSLTLATSTFTNYPITSLPTNPIFDCFQIEGIIGIDIIGQFDWFIDFKNHLLLKIDPLTDYSSKLEGFNQVQFSKKGLRPIIKLKFPSQTLSFLFDSGATSSDITHKDYKKTISDVLLSYDQVLSKSGATTLFNQSNEKLISLPNYWDNNLSYHAKFNTISLGENKIGNSFWGDGQLFFSWKKKMLTFKAKEGEQEAIFGLRFKIQNNAMVISSLINTKQLVDSGLKAGDVIKSIDNQVFSTNCELISYQLTNKSQKLTLELMDGKKITLTKEPLF